MAKDKWGGRGDFGGQMTNVKGQGVRVAGKIPVDLGGWGLNVAGKLEVVMESGERPGVSGEQRERDLRYWRANLRIIVVLLSIWAFASLGCSVLFIDVLNRVKFGQVPLGFWMAQQGTIYLFVVLIGIYVWLMDGLDREHGGSE